MFLFQFHYLEVLYFLANAQGYITPFSANFMKQGLSCLNGYVTLFGKCNQQVTFPIPLFSSTAFLDRYTMLHLIQLDLTLHKPNINPVSTWEGKKTNHEMMDH